MPATEFKVLFCQATRAAAPPSSTSPVTGTTLEEKVTKPNQENVLKSVKSKSIQCSKMSPVTVI